MALMIAVGELQQYAGPDQRVTATADIAGTALGEPLANGASPGNNTSLDGTSKGLTGVQAGTRYWTGVFANNDDPSLIYEKTPSPELLRWLVSSPTDNGNNADVNPANSRYQVGNNGSPADSDAAIVLVGANTFGNNGGTMDSYVSAPLVPIRSNDGTVRTGAYAWWVGDEGVKSRINISDQTEFPDDYDTLTAQRRGWESTDELPGYPTPSDAEQSRLTSIITLPSSELLLGKPQAGQSGGETLFHSASTTSRGLLTNTLEGGLKVDLTTGLVNGLSSSPPSDAYDNYPIQGGRVIPQATGTPFSRLDNLTWDHISDFVNRAENLDGGALIVSGDGGDDSISIAPSIIDVRLLLGVRTVKQSETQYRVYPCAKVAITIANPYSVPLKWEDDLQFQFKSQTPTGNLPARIWQHNSTCIFFPADETLTRTSREAAVFNQAVFTIPAGSLAPGEAYAFTNSGKVVRTARTATRAISVPMAPVDSVNPFDFNSCLELQTTAVMTLPQKLDIRESWQTTLVALEMRTEDNSRGTFLKRIERFELDNGYWNPTARNFDRSVTPNLTGPVPLMLYAFQISQPGMDYINLMPRDYELGQRGSTLRTFADFNLQATNFSKPIASYNPPPFFMESNDSAALLPFVAPGGDTGTGFTRNLGLNPVRWGYSNVRGSESTILYTVPRSFSSLAQFQHADLTNDEERVSIGHQPAYAVGNSYATPFVKRDSISELRADYELVGAPNHSGATQLRRTYFDMAHILNSCLWDRYYFSTLDQRSSTPRNPNLILADSLQDSSALSDPSLVAKELLVEGAFNVSSTNVNAWKALLSSTRYRVHPTTGEESSEASFPRSLEQIERPSTPPTGNSDDSYAGYRVLTNSEVEELATEITRQVRMRGPFLSMSHFVNRALADISDKPALSRSGALQQALDESGVNISHTGARNGFSGISANQDRVTLAHKNGAPRADLDGSDTSDRPSDFSRRKKDWAVTSRDNNFGAVASILADDEMLYDSTTSNEQGYRSTAIPGWMTQGDLLQVLAPSLAVRSDTFTIRTCGRSYSPAGKILATAYAEATVQRQIEYLDPSDPPETAPSKLNGTNLTFGRKFKIISFRWLSENEI
ncbi:hypothetical protein AAFN60_05205 [Roseibacillus persicicus]|uniref:hypothetical protein n=1 Tax=Roseibacillus persicicus TaxID=454148 RepID=UPI00398B1DB4